MPALSRPLRGGFVDGLRRFGWHHPEWWAVAAAGCAWIFLLWPGHPHAGHAGMAGMAMDGSRGSHGQGAPGMIAMVLAMMLPLTLTNIRHVALSSLWRRRHQGIVAFLAGYLAVWIAVQAGIGWAWERAAPLLGWKAAGIAAFVAAALWEIAPVKRRRIRRCHRTVPLAPRGWRADADCAHYGLTTGLHCVTMCWALMVACAAFAHSLPVMALLFGVQLSGRYRPRSSPTLVALTLLGACLLSFVAGFNDF